MTSRCRESAAVVQLTRSGMAGPSPADSTRLSREFEQLHCIRLPKLLHPDIERLVEQHLARAEFYERTHEGIGVEHCMMFNSLFGFLLFLANREPFFDFVRQVTGCGSIGCFAGRVYRMTPGSGHYDTWHSDVSETRMIGMSVNLSSQVYTGGVFQLRERQSQRQLCEIVNTGLADAILFRISPSLQHRITPLEGAYAKTAFAGWFQATPDYRSLLFRS